MGVDVSVSGKERERVREERGREAKKRASERPGYMARSSSIFFHGGRFIPWGDRGG